MQRHEMQAIHDRIQAAANTLLEKRDGRRPKVAMLLGTGHAELSSRLQDKSVILVEELPEFPRIIESSTFVIGSYSGMEVLIADAPMAPYLGIAGQNLAFPVRVFRAMGAEILILTAAAASLDPTALPGDLALIEDHMDFTRMTPLLGQNDDLMGPRFPDMYEPYCSQLRGFAKKLADEAGFPLHEGVFSAIQGPSLPTRAEYRFLRSAGSDFVGMSTVPEVLAAVHAGFRNLALLGITQKIDLERSVPTDLEAMVEASDLAAPRMGSLLTGLLERLALDFAN